MNGKAEVARLRSALDATFARARSVADLEAQSDYARYLCVLVSGYLEKSISELVLEHSRRAGGPTLQRFVEQSTRRFTNANAEKIKSLLGSFNADWKLALDGFLVDEWKDAVDSVVGLRHLIAHGGSAGVTFSRVRRYYERVQEVVDEIARLCAP